MKKFLKTIGTTLAVALFVAAEYTGCGYSTANSSSQTAAAAGTEGGAKTETKATTAASDLEAAPDFTVTDSEGNSVSLSDHLGKPVIINFWASWCGPCKSELGYFDELSAQYGESVDFMMVNLTDGYRETAEKVKAFLEENGYTFPVYFDEASSAVYAYSIYSIPFTVVIDADGNIVDTHTGAMSKEVIEEYLKEIL